ncbi:PTS system mannose/fructose/sorbose family transporter subunit IID, partial [Enterococcus faecium]|uniref:PTS system mannose/fructose/sorbose family transporter subunit IID n=1 Tax=Enterococcus faecium TaxID=1352 RepID=UPI003CC5B737
TGGGAETSLQSIFDQIFAGLLQLGITFLCVWLYSKGHKTITIILGIFVLCFLGTLGGII